MIDLDGKPQTSMDFIRLLLIQFMGLQQDHVSIYDNKWVMPNFEEMFITVEYRNGIPIANNVYFDADNVQGPQEHHVVLKLEKIVVGVFSKNDEAEYRKDEVPMALMSLYSQLMQEGFSFKIARVMPDQDLSSLEGASMLKRYDFEVSVYAWYKKSVAAPYIIPPFDIMVTANPPLGQDTIQANITQLSKLPSI